jgi:phospholipid-translocating ATPase
MALCHNVTPVGDGEDRTFQASSPDEIALVKVCESFGIKLASRDQTSIVLNDMHGKQYSYQILNNFPFSSETKRMGTIIRHEETDRYVFYLKGAD